MQPRCVVVALAGTSGFEGHASLAEKLGTTDQFIQRAHSEHCHDLAGFLGDAVEGVDHPIGSAFAFARNFESEVVILRFDAGEIQFTLVMITVPAGEFFSKLLHESQPMQFHASVIHR